MKRWLILMACLTGLAAAVGANERFTVKYVSVENVYIDGGQADDLAVGTRLVVLGKQGSKAELEVVYVAEHSASCKVIGAAVDIQAGDAVQLKTLPTVGSPIVADTSKPVAAEAKPIPEPTPLQVDRIQSSVGGNLSLSLYKWNDNSESNLDFSQATARISLKARRLWGKEITLSVRGRGRFDQRQRDYRSEIERRDWQNRLWEFSLSYDEPSAPVNVQVGRILPRRAGTIGYLDGLLAEARLSDRFRAGLFGGSYPDWLYDERGFTLMKGGGYFSYVAGEYRNLYFEQTLGAVGEYHGNDVNREFLVIQGQISRGSAWGLSHTGEVEINRSWRKSQAGMSFELSSLYVNGWIRPTSRTRFSLSYDNRTNYWTFDSRSVIDSLFDDRLRQGIRLQSDLTLPAHLFSSVSAGYRKRSGDPDPTWSYSSQLRKGDLLFPGLSLAVQYAAFDGPFNRGYNYSIRATSFFGGRYTVNAAYGSYAYRSERVQDYRNNGWIELSGQADFSRHYWLGMQLQTDSGDDIEGLRIQSELGYRF
jgi:hypothetical protein